MTNTELTIFVFGLLVHELWWRTKEGRYISRSPLYLLLLLTYLNALHNFTADGHLYSFAVVKYGTLLQMTWSSLGFCICLCLIPRHMICFNLTTERLNGSRFGGNMWFICISLEKICKPTDLVETCRLFAFPQRKDVSQQIWLKHVVCYLFSVGKQ